MQFLKFCDFIFVLFEKRGSLTFELVNFLFCGSHGLATGLI